MFLPRSFLLFPREEKDSISYRYPSLLLISLHPYRSLTSHSKMKRLTDRDFTQDRRDPQTFRSNERITIPTGSKWMIIKHPYVDTFNSLGNKVSSHIFISCRGVVPQVVDIDNIYSPNTWESEVIVKCKDDRKQTLEGERQGESTLPLASCSSVSAEEFVTVRITHISASGVTSPRRWEFWYSFATSATVPRSPYYSSPSPPNFSMKKLTNKDFSRHGEHTLLSNSKIHVPKGSKYVTISDLKMKAINFGRSELGPRSIHIAMSIGEDGIGMFTFPTQESGLPRDTNATIPVKESMEIKDGRMELVITASPGENAEVVGDWEFSYGFIGLLSSKEGKDTDSSLSSKSDGIQSLSNIQEEKTSRISDISGRCFSSSPFLVALTGALGLAGALASTATRSPTGLLISGSIMCISSMIFINDTSVRERQARVRRVACRSDE